MLLVVRVTLLSTRLLQKEILERMSSFYLFLGSKWSARSRLDSVPRTKTRALQELLHLSSIGLMYLTLSLSRLMPELMRFALVSQIQCSARMPPREELNLEASRKRATSSALGAIVGCDVRLEAEVAVS